MQRWYLLTLAAALASCHRDPAAWTVPPAAEPERATAPVAAGTQVVINLFESGRRTTATIDDARRLEHPICGEVRLPPSATTAADVCQAVAGCMAGFLRAPLVEVTLAAEGFATAKAGCEGPKASPPSVPSIEFMGLQKLLRAGPPQDEVAATALCEAAVERELLLYAYKPGHPQVQALTETLRKGTEAWTGAAEPSPTFATALQARQVDAMKAAAEASTMYGPKHPELIRLELAADRWQRLVEDAQEGLRAAAATPKAQEPRRPAEPAPPPS